MDTAIAEIVASLSNQLLSSDKRLIRIIFLVASGYISQDVMDAANDFKNAANAPNAVILEEQRDAALQRLDRALEKYSEQF
jgi:hypothetical protein